MANNNTNGQIHRRDEGVHGGTAITHEVDVLIVGFGYSSIPLLRELEKRGQDYTIVSSGMAIWEQLKATDKLGFNLVSSFHSSVLAEDQVEEGAIEDFFPTATWFHDYQERIRKDFKDKVVQAKVTLVENFSNFSLVHTDKGNLFKAENVVFATGLGRPQTQTIKELDMDTIKNKTIVINMSGDTANMMLAKAVVGGNKCIMLTNGYVVLDVLVGFDSPGPKGSHWFVPTQGIRTGKQYRIDLAQMESHTIGDLFPYFYKNFFQLSIGLPGPNSWLGKLLWPDVFHMRFPETYRPSIVERHDQGKAGVSNGLLAIKYYAIDMYELMFGDDLEKNISEGALLNDICFFHTEGLVETWRKNETTIDHKNKTIRGSDGRVVPFDVFIDGGSEVPNLPRIVSINEDGVRHEFCYRYRDTFLGCVPSRLKNIFFTGFTRPSTGGIANMIEMQGLMIHKLVSKPKMKAELYSSIDNRIRKYNEYYYVEQDKDLPSDHLVSYGLYTQEVAKYLGINRPIFRSALSMNPRKFILNLRFELQFANNAIKYRMADGDYMVKGADKYAREVFEFNEHNSLIFLFLLSCLWDRFLGYMCAGMLAWQYCVQPLVEHCTTYHWELHKLWSLDPETPLIPIITAAIVIYIALVSMEKNLKLIFLQTYSLPPPMIGFKATFQPLAMAYTAWAGEWYWCFAMFTFFCVIAYLGRQFCAIGLSGRYMFADCKYKHLYRSFWEEYKKAYAKVYILKQTKKTETSRPPLALASTPAAKVLVGSRSA